MVCRTLFTAMVLVGAFANAGRAQPQGTAGTAGTESVAAAVELYGAAAYREALAMLDALRARGAQQAEAVELEKYRALCLVVLGRTGDAEQAIGRILAMQPRFRLSDDEASGRILAAFDEMRRRVIPQAAQQAYELAEAAYRKQELAEAREGFSTVLALAEDAGDEPPRLVKDLATLARGFLVLVAANTPPLASMTLAQNVGIAPAMKSVYDATDTGVVPPSVVQQRLPRWVAGARTSGGEGVLELIVDENGRVEAATMVVPFNSPYDALLLEAARQWQYVPARCGGQAVKFRRLVRFVAGSQPGGPPGER
jgi:TonB family protein